MTGVARAKGILVTLAATTIVLAGCLSEGESGSETVTPPPPDPGPTNSAPTISGSPPGEVTANNEYSFTPAANDADGDTLTFSIRAKPGWASFDNTTGRLSGTPSAEHVGTYSNITITVSDGSASASLGPFSILVREASGGGPNNSAPTISGTPPGEVTVNNEYSFTPSANDADGDTLSFSIDAKPAWASFDNATGHLSGTPLPEHVGNYSNITITVSDGSASATLGPFSILVSDEQRGSVTLSWTAPTQNEDGSELTDLDGYRLYWGTTPGNYTDSVTIDNESVSTYVVDNLPFGTYEFVATSFNTSGIESRYSNPVSKVVNQ